MFWKKIIDKKRIRLKEEDIDRVKKYISFYAKEKFPDAKVDVIAWKTTEEMKGINNVLNYQRTFTLVVEFERELNINESSDLIDYFLDLINSTPFLDYYNIVENGKKFQIFFIKGNKKFEELTRSEKRLLKLKKIQKL